MVQENHIKVSSRTLQLLSDVLEGSKGLQFDKVWASLQSAQAKSGIQIALNFYSFNNS